MIYSNGAFPFRIVLAAGLHILVEQKVATSISRLIVCIRRKQIYRTMAATVWIRFGPGK